MLSTVAQVQNKPLVEVILLAAVVLSEDKLVPTNAEHLERKLLEVYS